MARRLTLFIGGQPADVGDNSYVLMNYEIDAISNPAAVKNSFSKQVTLPGTSANNIIFNQAFRLDRTINRSSGLFNPARKTPFEIRNELNEIVEAGYLRLDGVGRNGANVEYKVTLFGELGLFLYGLTYDGEGNKKSLADLVYLNPLAPDEELNFYITRQAVSDAWQTPHSGALSLWKVINFAPCYNGIPDKGFAADKAVGRPYSFDLAESVTVDGVNYSCKNHEALFNLSQQYDEWAVKDLRSYLQRPVISIRAILDAISNPDNNGGYSVDLSNITDPSKFPYQDMWLTLPMLPSLGSGTQSEGDADLVLTSAGTAGTVIGTYEVDNHSIPAGSDMLATINFALVWGDTGATASTLSLSWRHYDRIGYYVDSSVLFVQAVAYASDNSIIGGSDVYIIGSARADVDGIVNDSGYTPTTTPGAYRLLTRGTEMTRQSNGDYISGELALSVKSKDIDTVRVVVTRVFERQTTLHDYHNPPYDYTYTGLSNASCLPTLYDTAGNDYAPETGSISGGSADDTVSYTTTGALRSGSLVTKKMLLSSTKSPADYLIALCKIFGLYITVNAQTKTVTVQRRSDFYTGNVSTAVDLTKRIDASSVSISPFACAAKWYELRLEEAQGAYAKEYYNANGRHYGSKRYDTGYDFDRNTVNLLDKCVIRSAAAILDRNKYWCRLTKSLKTYPSPFLDSGQTYTLWSATDETTDVPIPCPDTSWSLDYYNNANTGCDIADCPKAEFRDSSNKAIAGEDVLLMFQGNASYIGFHISDDTGAMNTLNGGVPCWSLPDAAVSVTLPIFSRYIMVNGAVTKSLDFAVPAVLDIPGVANYPDLATIGYKAWNFFLADRYDINTKVLKCKVDLTGLRNGTDLLRPLYYYGGALWALAKITNQSLTTEDLTECEFIQVQNADDYTNYQYFD